MRKRASPSSVLEVFDHLGDPAGVMLGEEVAQAGDLSVADQLAEVGHQERMSHWTLPDRDRRSSDLAAADHVFAEIGAQDIGHVDPAVGPLVVFQDHDQGPAEGDGRSVERVDEPGALLAGGAIADIQAGGPDNRCSRTCWSLRRTRRARRGRASRLRDRTCGTPGRPGRPSRYRARGTGCRATGTSLSSIASISAWICARGFGRAEGEHLDLGELVDAIKAAAGPAGGAGLGAEAVRQARRT